jgi:hypothetical protein
LYKIRTAPPLPADAHGYNWMQFFTSQFTGQRPYLGWHDGKNTITIECSPDDAPGLTKAIDAAIEYANERLRAL